MKKTIAALLSAVLFLSLLTALPASAEAVEDTHFISGDYVCFKNGDGTVSLLRYQGKEDEIVIPGEIEGLKVTEILSNCFFMTPASSITIPDGVTKIGLAAFSDSSSLTSIVFPESLEFISASAFYNCKNLKTIAFPKNISYVGLGAFTNTAWYDSQPDGAVYIGKACYQYKGTMPKNTKLNVKNGTVSISQQAFFNCKNLAGITLPASLKEIGIAAFSDCTGLKSIVIPNGVEKLQSSVFYHCTNLEQITLPDSMKEVGYQVFEDTKWFKNQKDSLVYVGRIAYRYNGTMPVNTVVKIRENTIGLGIGVFSGCNNLSNVILPESLTEIPESAFQGCASLKSVELPQSLTVIQDRAFAGCESLTSISPLDQVTEIGESAFRDCTSFKTFTVPSGVKTLRGMTFSGCTALEQVILPQRLETIGSNTFENCIKLKQVNIPESINSIAYQAFLNCKSLESLELHKYIVEIESGAFEGCSSLSNIQLPYGLKKIGYNAFLNCESLKNIIIPKNVSEIEGYALGFVSDLEGVLYHVNDFTISGYEGSAAQQYAEGNELAFTPIDYKLKTGDIDGDGSITTADVLELQKHLSKVIELTEEQVTAADTDGNGKLEINDVLRIQLYLAKKIAVL